MTGKDTRSEAPPDPVIRIHRWIATIVVAVMAFDFALIVYRGQWLNAALIVTIAALILLPALLNERMSVRIPYEFQIASLVFVFASLFLGEVRSYYDRFWWWDIVLHTSSGLLLGIVGFLLVYVLNESRRVDLAMRPRFVALFAFLFAVAVGAVWEIFEFTMDQVVGTQMQKPMLGDPSGLTDTMWDLIVDTLGAMAISALGWSYMHTEQKSFIDRWIQKFVDHNPGLFRDSPTGTVRGKFRRQKSVRRTDR